MTHPLSRRAFLSRSALVGCSLAASPLVTPVSFAAAPWDGRLVVIILRGGMDALDVVQPYGDREFAGLRPALKSGPRHGAHDLDGFFSLHPALGKLRPLWSAGELGFAHAVSTPYRDKRSHFDGQDLLEAGTSSMAGVRDGWLNRMLQVVPGVQERTAYAIGHGDMALLSGPAPAANWSPDVEFDLSPQARRLAGLIMEQDPAFHAALDEALMIADQAQPASRIAEDSSEGMQAGMMAMGQPEGRGAHVDIASFAARQLAGDARVAAFSINGWDTHNQQTRGLKAALGRLSDTILTLKSGLGPSIWGKTAVLAMTEFGRTARQNGTAGTDHGTGGAMVMAGGAIRGGRVFGQWPGLAEADLYDRRDLMPTADVRAYAGWAMRGMTGLSRADLEQTVFPGLDLGDDPGLLL